MLKYCLYVLIVLVWVLFLGFIGPNGVSSDNTELVIITILALIFIPGPLTWTIIQIIDQLNKKKNETTKEHSDE